MATDTVNEFDEFTDDLYDGQHDGVSADTDVIKVALTNSAPAGTEVNWNTTDFPEPTGTGYTAGGETISYTLTQSGGRQRLTLDTNVVWTAGAGGISSVRYAIFYNSSSATPTNAAIGWIDYGSSIAPSESETFTINSGTIVDVGTV